jgi:hypothetical protein
MRVRTLSGGWFPGRRRIATRLRRFTRFVLAHKVTACCVLLIALVPPMGAGMWQDATSSAWNLKDWVALSAGVWTALWFLVLAGVLSLDVQRRTEAVADAEVSKTIGSLALAGSRSMTGEDPIALTIPSDALAALEHYEVASRDHQQTLVSAIQVAITDVIFGTVCRADSLPRSVWERLCGGTRHLQKRLAALAEAEPVEDLRSQLHETGALVRLCYELGTALRGEHWTLDSGGRIDLSHVMRRSSEEWARADRCTDTTRALKVLERLYAQELAVVRDWGVLRRCDDRGVEAEPDVDLLVSLESIDRAKEWFAPWYVARREDGASDQDKLRAVNVNNQPLDEAASRDVVPVSDGLPEWPVPLRHGQIPDHLRQRAVDKAHMLLERQTRPGTICVLLYELAPSAPDASPKRLVLDGNHRLAGAVRLASRDPNPSDAHTGRPSDQDPRVLAFTIRERVPIVDEATDVRRSSRGTDHWHWRGFTPDVENLRLAADQDPSHLMARQMTSNS